MSNNNKSKVDPGWNDPPMLNYNSSNPPPKSRITNKRVAFPLNTTNSISPAPPSNLPLTGPPVPVFSIENTKEHLGRFFNTDQSKELFYKVWTSELPDDCKKTLSFMTECLVKNNKVGAELHKKELLNSHKISCENWIKDVKFE